jgi:hypothetical protein
MTNNLSRQYFLAVVQVTVATLAFCGVSGAQEKPVQNPSTGEIYERPSQGPEGSPPVTGPAPSRAIVSTAPAQDSGKPFKLGTFLLYPEFVANWMYDSNVYYTSEAISDHAMIYSPAAWLQSNWDRHALNFYAAADLTRYSRYTTENTQDWRLSAEGRFDINADTNVYGGLRRSQDHQDRESPDVRNGVTPTPYTQEKAYGGFYRHFDRVSLRLAGTWQQLDYKDVEFFPGSGGAVRLINNDDRDRRQYTAGIRLGYEVSPTFEPYLLAATDDRRYDNSPDDTGYFRDSDGRRYVVGLRYAMPKTLKLDMFAGYLTQDYDDPQLKDVSTPLFGGSLLWVATPKLRMTLNMDRTVEETTLTQTLSDGPPPVLIPASSYTNTFSSVGANYSLDDKLSLHANLSYSQSKYNGLDRDDAYYGGGVGMAYRVGRNFNLDVNWAYRNLHSSNPGENFIKRQVFVGLVFPMSH